MVGVADREGVGQRVVERDVLARQIRHRGGALVRHPAVVACRRSSAACVSFQPCGRSSQELQAQVRRVRVERQHAARCRPAGARPARPKAASRRADRRSRARRAACRSSDRTSGSPASGSRCARHRRCCPCGGGPESRAHADAGWKRRRECTRADSLQKPATISRHGTSREHSSARMANEGTLLFTMLRSADGRVSIGQRDRADRARSLADRLRRQGDRVRELDLALR